MLIRVLTNTYINNKNMIHSTYIKEQNKTQGYNNFFLTQLNL